ncbi:hypothetical protein ANRL3_00516 [Anaerolineae bacterium]|nr:hypothetical protein ANRL3_00516 [Anaerolineae bacterium]
MLMQVQSLAMAYPRLARKWELDPEFETLVRKAWEMKLAGRSHLAIHRATRLFKGVTGYTAFFSNISYAGYRRCAKLIVPEAQPAYISKVDFDRIQAARPPARYSKDSLLEHPRRRKEDNPFILSGLLYCGYCGGTMVANTNGHARNYRCLRQTRNGPEACTQHGIVAYWLHRAVCNWVSENVISLDHFLASREEVNRRLSGASQELKQRRTSLNKNLNQVNRSIKNLLDAIEASGFSQEIGARLAERKVERAKLEAELNQIMELQKVQAIEVSDEVLAHLAEHLSEELASGNPNEVRRVLRQVLRRVELYEDKLVIQHVAPIVPHASGAKVGFGLDSDGCLGRPTTARGSAVR